MQHDGDAHKLVHVATGPVSRQHPVTSALPAWQIQAVHTRLGQHSEIHQVLSLRKQCLAECFTLTIGATVPSQVGLALEKERFEGDAVWQTCLERCISACLL